jgi:hypothetical protein
MQYVNGGDEGKSCPVRHFPATVDNPDREKQPGIRFNKGRDTKKILSPLCRRQPRNPEKIDNGTLIDRTIPKISIALRDRFLNQKQLWRCHP